MSNRREADLPRPPYSYADKLIREQRGICAWPPCRSQLTGAVEVDHRHDKCCPGRYSCPACVRGAVHKRCNAHEIEGCETARRLGALLPPAIIAYLDQLPHSTSNKEAA